MKYKINDRPIARPVQVNIGRFPVASPVPTTPLITIRQPIYIQQSSLCGCHRVKSCFDYIKDAMFTFFCLVIITMVIVVSF